MSADRRYVVDELSVLVPARVASVLHEFLTPLRIQLRGRDSQVDRVLLDIAQIAMAFRSPLGTPVVPQREPAGDLSEWMSTTNAADRLGITSRAVRRAIDEQRLPARFDDGRWRIAREHVEQYRAARDTRAA